MFLNNARGIIGSSAFSSIFISATSATIPNMNPPIIAGLVHPIDDPKFKDNNIAQSVTTNAIIPGMSIVTFLHVFGLACLIRLILYQGLEVKLA